MMLRLSSPMAARFTFLRTTIKANARLTAKQYSKASKISAYIFIITIIVVGIIIFIRTNVMTSFLEEAAETALPSIYNLQSDVYHDLHPREIRLVKLLKGRWSDKIHCKLHHVPLANRPSYKALSYAWGSPRATRPILVNGYQHSVTVNLESALRRLRRVDGDLTVWIDALCINQSNNSERTEQVNLMHDIFTFTEEVIVYLGEVPQSGSMEPNGKISESNKTIYCNQRDAKKLKIFRNRYTAKRLSKVSKGKTRMDSAFDVFCFLRLLSEAPDSNSFPSFDPTSGKFVDTKYQQKVFEELRQLMRSRWWYRIWVIQEVVVPRKIIMVYGSASAPWEMFVNAARWESQNRSSTSPSSFPHEYSAVLVWFSRIILDIDRMRELWKDGQQTALLPLLRRFSGRKASDDRDKVYALLSLARNQTSIIPNYSLNVPEVFQTTILDIIERTRSLTALAGDLGRKDRQDLPSWVPDWSASYDDLDRRRADYTEHYNTTDRCEVYVQDEGAIRWNGIHRYLDLKDQRGNRFDVRAILSRTGGLYESQLNGILRIEGWTDWLPDDTRGYKLDGETCLAAISDVKSATGRAVCLQNHGCGVIELSGLCQDKIAVTGETAFSDELLLAVIHSWAALTREYFFDSEDNFCVDGLGNAFRRTLCADTVPADSDSKDSVTRRIETDDHGLIAAWFLQGADSTVPSVREENRKSSWKAIFNDLGNYGSHMPPKPVSPRIDIAIRAATVRRTFFITQKGRIGLGPAKMRVDDYVYILLGSPTPFILRQASTREVLRIPNQPRLGKIKPQCYEVVGDCYVHGLMDGEAMEQWRTLASPNQREYVTQMLLHRWYTSFKIFESRRTQLTAWRMETARDSLFSRMANHGGYDLSSLQSMFEGRIRWDWTAKDRAQAESYTSTLTIWKYQIGLMKDVKWMAELIRAAELKVKQIESDIAEAESKMDQTVLQLTQHDMTGQNGRVFLV